jgi:hypothetical protein
MSSGRKSSVTRSRELAEARRRAALVCFLWQSYRDAVDQAVDMFDKLLTRASTQAQNELDEQLRRQRQTIQVSLTTIQVSLTTLRSLDRIILDDAISDEELRAQALYHGFARGVGGLHGQDRRVGKRTFSTASSGAMGCCASSRRHCSTPWSSTRTSRAHRARACVRCRRSRN